MHKMYQIPTNALYITVNSMRMTHIKYRYAPHNDILVNDILHI
jgi:hypothetical protein